MEAAHLTFMEAAWECSVLGNAIVVLHFCGYRRIHRTRSAQKPRQYFGNYYARLLFSSIRAKFPYFWTRSSSAIICLPLPFNHSKLMPCPFSSSRAKFPYLIAFVNWHVLSAILIFDCQTCCLVRLARFELNFLSSGLILSSRTCSVMIVYGCETCWLFHLARIELNFRTSGLASWPSAIWCLSLSFKLSKPAAFSI